MRGSWGPRPAGDTQSASLMGRGPAAPRLCETGAQFVARPPCHFPCSFPHCVLTGTLPSGALGWPGPAARGSRPPSGALALCRPCPGPARLPGPAPSHPGPSPPTRPRPRPGSALVRPAPAPPHPALWPLWKTPLCCSAVTFPARASLPKS